MLIYYVLYSFFGIVALVSSTAQNKVKAKKAVTIICVISLILLFGLRHPSMGNDLHYGMSNGYLSSFSAIGRLSWKTVLKGVEVSNYEYGYILFNKIIYFIFPKQQALLLACAIVTWTLIGITVYKNSDSPMLTLVLYMGLPSLLMMFSGLRQSLAFSITAFSYNYIKDKKPVKFLITVLIAWLFHKTAFFFLVAYPLYYVKRTQIFTTFSIIGIPTVFVFRYPLFAVFSKLFKDEAGANETSSYTLMIVFYLIYIFCTIFLNKEDKEAGGLLNLFGMACVFQMFGSINNLAMRMGYYFMLFLALLLPRILKNVDKEKNIRDVSKILIVTIFVVYGLYALKSSTWACSNPYHFFWETV